MLRILTRSVDLLAGVLFAIVAVAILISMFAGTADVIAIRLFSRTIRGTVEFSQNLMPIIVFGSLAFVQRNNQHIRVEFIYDRLGARGKAVLDALNALIVTVAAAALTWVSWRGYVRSNMIKESGMAFPFPIYPVKGFIVIGFALMVIKMFVELLVAIDRIRHPVDTGSAVDRVLAESAALAEAAGLADADTDAQDRAGDGSGSRPGGGDGAPDGGASSPPTR